MPRGYLKHNKSVSKKKQRGGHSRYDGTTRSNPWRGRSEKWPMFANSLSRELEDAWEYDVPNPKESSGSPAATTVLEGECAICLEQSMLVPLMKNCKHAHACRDCLRDMFVLHAQSDVGNYPLKCFHPPCNRLVPGSVLNKHGLFHSEQELSRHHRLNVLAKAYAGTKKVYHCPSCDHPSYYRPPAMSHMDRNVDCRNCHTKFNIAGSETRETTTIAAVEAIKSDKAGRNDGWARCPNPKCQMIISKGDGCEWMNCPCGQFFIWGDAVQQTDKTKTVVNYVEPTLLD